MTSAGDDVREPRAAAVPRLREESRWRIAREARWRTFVAWCALTTLGSGATLVALDAWEVRQAARDASAAEQRAAIAGAHAGTCHRLGERLMAIEEDAQEKLTRAVTEEERARIRAAWTQAARYASWGAPRDCPGPGLASTVPAPRPCVMPPDDDSLAGL